ncbi:MAG: ThiF family adenylyltransferase [Planctomycetota bacterium]|jgi:molybdopterin/thiamine biosynthesis adenylyltransferase|nr:ThiF family adenylyltransferase [Planctomycetota bacterium]
MAVPERYSRQQRFAPIGAAGQERIAAARVLVLGCGALGSAVAEQLARAGVGTLRLVDRDFVEASNLGRQCLYTEADAAAAAPKAVAAAERLRAINASLHYHSVVAHVSAANIDEVLSDIDLAVDGGDNFALRHILNEACQRRGIPWVYGACVGAYGCSMPVLPGETACLRCLQDELPAAGDGPTCDTAGVIAPAVHLVAAWQVAEVLKLLCGDRAAVRRELWISDLWAGSFQRLDTVKWRDPRCRACGEHADYPALAERDDPAIVLCGRDGFQITRKAVPDLARFAEGLGPALLSANAYLVRWHDDQIRGTVFADGRVIVQGTGDEARARSFCDRYLG